MLSSTSCNHKQQLNTPGDHLNGLKQTLNQHSMNSNGMVNQQPSKSGIDIYNFILPSEEDCDLAPGKNLEPNSAGLKSSQTGKV